MADYLSRPGKGTRGIGLPSGGDGTRIYSNSDTSTSGFQKLPGTAGVNLATGDVRLFGLENQPVNATDTTVRPPDVANSNVYRVDDLTRTVATLVEGAPGFVSQFMYNEPPGASADVTGSKQLAAQTAKLYSKAAPGSRIVEGMEAVGGAVGQVPVLSNVVGIAGNVLDVAATPVKAALGVGGGILGIAGGALKTIFDFEQQKVVFEPRAEEAKKWIDLAIGKNMELRRAEYDRIHSSPFPWDWGKPEAYLGWEDYLLLAKRQYEKIGTEGKAGLEDPAMYGTPGWLAGIGSNLEWIYRVSLPGQIHRSPDFNGLEYVSRDFIKMYTEDVPMEDILSHFRETGQLTNVDPINAAVFSLVDPIGWVAFDAPVVAARSVASVGRPLGQAYRATASGEKFADALAKSQMSKGAYAVLKHTKAAGRMWAMGEDVSAAIGSKIKRLPERLWAPTTYQAAVEELGTATYGPLNPKGSGASLVKEYHDLHARIDQSAAESFSSGFEQAVAYNVSQETLHTAVTTESRVTALGQAEELIRLAARGDIEALKAHPMMIGQRTETIDELVAVMGAYAKNPAGDEELRLASALWEKFSKQLNEANNVKNMPKGMNMLSNQVKWMFNEFRPKILASARTRIAESKARFPASDHMRQGLGASGKLFEDTVQRHLAASGKVGDEVAEATIRESLGSVFNNLQQKFNAAADAQKADIIEEFTSHLEIARMAAYGKALEYGLALRRLPGLGGTNILSSGSLTAEKLAEEINLLEAAINASDESLVKDVSKRVVHNYEQTRAQWDTSVVIDDLIDETPLSIGRSILASLKRIREQNGYVSPNSKVIDKFELILDGPDAKIANLPQSTPAWDIIPSTANHSPFDGEVDLNEFSDLITARNQYRLLLTSGSAAKDVASQKKVFEETVEMLKRDFEDLGGPEKVSYEYETFHKGVGAITELGNKDHIGHKISGLRPNENQSYISDLKFFAEDTPILDEPFQISTGLPGSSNPITVESQPGFDFNDFFRGEVTALDSGYEAGQAIDGFHIAGMMGDEKRYLVKVFTNQDDDLHTLLIRNRIARHIASSHGPNTVWAFPEIKFGVSNRGVQPTGYEAVQSYPAMQFEQKFAVMEDHTLRYPNPNDAFGYADSSMIPWGSAWTQAKAPGSVNVAKATWGTVDAIQGLSAPSLRRLLLDPIGVLNKYLVRAEHWADGGGEFRAVLLQLNSDGELIKATQFLDPKHVRRLDVTGAKADPGMDFFDWFDTVYLETKVSGSNVTIRDLLKKTYPDEQLAMFEENVKLGTSADAVIDLSSDGKKLLKAILFDDPNLQDSWRELPRKLLNDKKIRYDVAKKKSDYESIFDGFTHSFADWLHAWDSHIVSNGSDIAAYSQSGLGTVFEAIADESYMKSMWRRFDEFYSGKPVNIAYREGKGPEDLAQMLGKYESTDQIAAPEEIYKLLYDFRQIAKHPYTSREDYIFSSTGKGMLHAQAETFGTLADRGLINFADSVVPFNPLGDNTLFGDSGVWKDPFPASMRKDPGALLTSDASVEGYEAVKKTHWGIFDLTPRMYAENGTLLQMPKVVDLRKISSPVQIRPMPTSAFDYPYVIQPDIEALAQNWNSISWGKAANVAKAEAIRKLHEDLVNNPQLVEGANLYKGIRDLGYTIGRDPADGKIGELKYVVSPITKQVVPIDFERPFIPIDKIMSRTDLGIRDANDLVRQANNMNFVKRGMIEWANSEMYAMFANRIWRGSNGRLSENDAYSITAHLFRKAINQDINPQGLTAQEVADIFVIGMGGDEIARRKFVKIFGGEADGAGPRALLLYAAAGDLRKIGLAPYVSKSFQARFPALATWVNKIHPLARYRYNPFFNQQEAIEPLAILEWNGIRGERVREEASLLTGLLSAPGTARWDNWETGAQVLRSTTSIVEDAVGSNKDLAIWGNLRAPRILGYLANIAAPVGQSARDAIVAMKASAIQQQAYNIVRVRGGMQKILNFMPEVTSWLRSRGTTESEEAMKYILDSGVAGAFPSVTWGDKVSARWTTGTILDRKPLDPVVDILRRAELGEAISPSEIDQMASAQLVAEMTGATDDAIKELTVAFQDFFKTIKARPADNVPTTGSGAWKGLEGATTLEGVTQEAKSAISSYTSNGYSAINEYLAAKAEFGVQSTAQVKNLVAMEEAATKYGAYDANLKNPFQKMDDVIAAIDDAISKNVIVSEAPLYRGATLSDFLTQGEIQNLKVGSEFGLENIGSWSRSARVAGSFSGGKGRSVVLEIQYPVGIPGIDVLAGNPISRHIGEAEVLLPRGLRWRVDGIGETSKPLFETDPNKYAGYGGSGAIRLVVSPIIDRSYRMNVSGLAAEPAAIQGLRQAVNRIYTEQAARYETAKNAYKLVELFPRIKDELYRRAVDGGVVLKPVKNIDEIYARQPKRFSQNYQMKDPTTGNIQNLRVEFSEKPGPTFIDSMAAKVTKTKRKLSGMNPADTYIGIDGVERLVKTPGVNADSPADKVLAAINEWVAQRVYRQLGFAVPETSLSAENGNALIVSKWINEITKKPIKDWTQEEARIFAEGSLADLIFGSHDPLGNVGNMSTVLDNTGIDNLGQVVRIDMGSFGLFRAGGNRKSKSAIEAFKPEFWFGENNKAAGSKWAVAKILEKAYPDSAMIKSKPNVITNSPRFIEMADELIGKIDSMGEGGFSTFIRALFKEGYDALAGKTTFVPESELTKLADDTTKMIENNLVGVRQVLGLKKERLSRELKAYEEWKAAQAAGDTSLAKPELSFTPDSTMEYLFERLAYHHQNRSMLPLWEETLSKIARNEMPTNQEVEALAQYLPDFVLPKAQMEAVYRAGSMAFQAATKTAVVRQLYPTEKTWFERSLNHPYLGIYPLSYQLHKVLPEFLQGLFLYAPFYGKYKPGYGLYQLQQINDHIAAAIETSPELQQFIADRPPLLLWFNGILPGFPTDVSVSAPYWMRAGLLGPIAQGRPEDIPGNLARAGLTSLKRTIGPLNTGEMVVNIATDIADFIIQNNPFGQMGGAAGPIQRFLNPGIEAPEEMINREP